MRFLKAATAAFMTAYVRTSANPLQMELHKKLITLVTTLVGVVFIGGCIFYELEQVRRLCT